MRVLDPELGVVAVDGGLRMLPRLEVCHGYSTGCDCSRCESRERRRAFLEPNLYEQYIQDGIEPRKARELARTAAANIAARDAQEEEPELAACP